MAFSNTILGGGTFTGRAVYDQGGTVGTIGTSTDTIAEDVSSIVSMISPYETPLLTLLGDSDFPAQSVLHEWLEDGLTVNSVTVNGAIAANVVTLVLDGNANELMIGTILEVPSTGEYIQVNSHTSTLESTSIGINRGLTTTTAATIPDNEVLTVIGESTVEGSDVLDDVSKTRLRKTNTCQIFKKDVIVSGTMRSVRNLGGIVDELDYQVQMRTREALRDLEKMIIRGIGPSTANNAGTGTQSRLLKGLRQFITTNNTTGTAINIGTDSSVLNNQIKGAWDTGGTDLDVIVCGAAVKEKIDLMNSTRVRVVNEESAFRDVVSTYESTYGSLRVVLSRWMPEKEGLILASNRVKVVPLTGRSFQFQPVAKTGDSSKGMVLGEYTLEVRNEEGMARFIIA